MEIKEKIFADRMKDHSMFSRKRERGCVFVCASVRVRVCVRVSVCARQRVKELKRDRE